MDEVRTVNPSGLGHMLGIVVLAAAWLCLPAPATADPGAPLVVRASPDLSLLGQRVVEVLRRRGHLARVGEAPSGAIPEVSAVGEITLWPTDTGLEVRLIGPEGRDRVAHLPSLDARDESSARIAVLALEALLDAPLPTLAATYDPDAPAYALRYPEFAPGGALYGRHQTPPVVMPMVILRFMLGYSSATGGLLVGPGAGLGICAYGHCLLLEAGLSLLPEDRLVDAERYRFRSVDTGIRLLLRVWQGDIFGVHTGFGFLSRVGEAFALDSGERRVASDLGVRTTLEVSARVSGPFEFVLEGGVDAAITRATFLRAAQRIYLEDRVRPWVVFGVRLRPRMGLEN